MVDYSQESVKMHAALHGKIEVKSKVDVKTLHDLSTVYTPGVAAPCNEIAADPSLALEYTIKRNSVAVVTDGSAVLGLGNIGPLAAMPVMEGKALLFKQFGGVDAWPICLATQDPDEIIQVVRAIAPGFGGINLEDIAAPNCFYIERSLQDLGIPVFHDDQHGTSIVAFAALMNAAKVLGRDLKTMRVVVNGAGAAGMAIADLLCGVGTSQGSFVADVLLCDSKGLISSKRSDLTPMKRETLDRMNLEDRSGSLQDALVGADIFLGVSKANLLKGDDVRKMAKNPIIIAMANPVPEILPDVAKAAGAAIVGTGRSDFHNQVNNALVFPGLFRGLLDAQAPAVLPSMRYAAAQALANVIRNPSPDQILPNLLDPKYDVAGVIAKAVYEEAMSTLVG